MRRVRQIALLVLSAVVVLLPGCERRPILAPSNPILLRLKIDLNIQNVDPLTFAEPEVMRVLFYDPVTNTKISEDYLPATGGPINIVPGDYTLLVYNFDTESVLIKNDSYFHDIEAYTGPISSTTRANVLQTIQKAQATRAAGDDQQSAEDAEWDAAMKALQNSEIVYEPDHLFVARQPITIYETTGEQVIETDVATVVETYYISVRVKNIQYMASAQALLTGQVKSNKIGYDKETGKSTEDVTLYFQMGPGTDAENNDVVCAHFNTFGKLPNAESRLWLTILITNTDGTTAEWHRDITDEFHEEDPDDDRQIIIVEPEIDIPKPETGTGGGFTPIVDDWEEEQYDINI